MFQKLVEGRKRYGLTTYLRRQARLRFDRVFARVEREGFAASLRELGLKEGSTVVAHAALSKLGYVEGGPDTVIDALQDVVGRQGCIMMPTFPTAGSMADLIDTGLPFDFRTAPSRVGILTEVFRRRPDVIRSLHPTNAVAAWGERAGELIAGHENSLTPYGFETPYGRIAEQNDSYVLMLETHIHSFLHHLQERVAFPNLFLDGDREATYIDRDGSVKTMRTRVMRPRIPYFVAIPAAEGHDPDWAILHDFGLIFPAGRTPIVRSLDYRFEGYQGLFRRRDQFAKSGALTIGRAGKGEIGLLHIRSYLDRIEPELKGLIDRYREHYDVARIEEMNLPYA